MTEKPTYDEVLESLNAIANEIQRLSSVKAEAEAALEQLVQQYNYTKGIVDYLAPEEVEVVEGDEAEEE